MLLTSTESGTTRIQVSCDGRGCNMRFNAKQPGVFDRACVEQFAQAMGWVFRADGRMLCAECAEREDEAAKSLGAF
jgi:hypothetical protein